MNIFDQIAANPANPPTLREVFGHKEPVLRTNRNNTGKDFQLELESTGAGYQTRGIARFEKVDPPVAIIWPFNKHTGKKEQRVIFKENPHLDYVGVWSKRGGRMLSFEAKSTSAHRLAFNGDNGLTATQWAAMKSWRMAGAATFLLWRYAGAVALFTPELMQAAQARGDKSLVFENGIKVPRGEGRIVWDFLPVVEGALWPAKESCE